MVWNHDLHLDGLLLDEGDWFGVYIVNCRFYFVVYMFLKHGRDTRCCSLSLSRERNDDKLTSSD